eukprot:g6478.t1 g6478   contig23:560103-562466(-)
MDSRIHNSAPSMSNNGTCDLLDGDAHQETSSPSLSTSTSTARDAEPDADYFGRSNSEDYTDDVNAELPPYIPDDLNNSDENYDTPARSVNNDAFPPRNKSARSQRHHELAQRTLNIMSDYSNFLSELDDKGDDDDEERGGSSQTNNHDTSSSSAYQQRNEFGSGTALQSAISHPFEQDMRRSWARDSDGNLATIDEDWGYDYDNDRRRVRYRRFTCSKLRLMMAVAACIAALVGIGYSVSKKNTSPTSNSVDKQSSSAPTAEHEEEPPALSLDENNAAYQQQQLYKAIATTLQPIWFSRENGWNGKAYLEAYKFCYQHEERVPCSYTAYCPAGPGHIPLGGVKAESKGSWAPVNNAPNEWVNVGDDGMCRLYSETHGGDNPRWGLTGKNEELTRHIMCCKKEVEDDGDYPGVVPIDDEDNMASDLYNRPPDLEEDVVDSSVTDSKGEISMGLGDVPTLPTAASSSSSVEDTPPTAANSPSIAEETPPSPPSSSPLRAHWFTRNDGWTGTTYNEAVSFCFTKSAGVCNYNEYCPNGEGQLPTDGPRDAGDNSTGQSLLWSPTVMSGKETWVGVGVVNTCVQSNVGLDLPDEMVDHATSFVLCCRDEQDNPNIHPNQIPNQSSSSASVVSGQDTQSTSTPVGSKNYLYNDSTPSELDEFSQVISDAFSPLWFSRQNNWGGGTYEEAVSYCGAAIHNGALCDFEALCPNGEGTTPYTVDKPTMTTEQWVPVNKSDMWVLVGQQSGANSDRLCKSHEALYGHEAMFGLTGGEKEEKEYILCCHPLLDAGSN